MSCIKETKTCIGASGGNLNITAYLYHHDSLIVNKPGYLDTVFVKYNSSNLPGLSPSDYDTYFVGDSASAFVKLTGLRCGDYYFYGVGMDTVSSPGHPFHVSGGTPFSTSEISGEIIIHVPVTE